MIPVHFPTYDWLKGPRRDDDRARTHRTVTIMQYINGSRKRRIAGGSGTKVEDINQFLREFHQMQKLMKRMGGKKMRGMGAMGGLFKG